MNILYISDCFVGLSVFYSQVHTLCNKHSVNNNVTLFAMRGLLEQNSFTVNELNYRLCKVRRLPKAFIPFVNKINVYIAYSYKGIFYDADIIHCRGHVGTAFAINMCRLLNIRKPIIADIRGEIVEELKNDTNKFSNFYAQEAEKIEKLVFNNANYFFFVSQNMQNYYKEKYKFIQDSNSTFFPTIVDENFFYVVDSNIRKQKREELNINNKYVYVYCGGVSYWQNLDKILLKFNSVNNENIFLLLIVTDTQKVLTLMRTLMIKNKNIRVLSLPYQQVGQYLNAADAGVIIRNNNIINKVASPTKINEYLACGLKIVDNIDQIGTKEHSTSRYLYKPLKEIINGQQEVYNFLV